MATKDAADDTPVDNRDALEVLESEAKEWEKVPIHSMPGCPHRFTDKTVEQDAEIDRILKAFRLDA
jgi:DnaJ family protein C protein 8